MAHLPEQHPLRLPSGTQVGHWRLVGWHGQGTYGAVYQAVRVGQERSGPVALKLALHSWDSRFAREAELLSRLSHPSIPRLLHRGLLRLPSGVAHPYLVMEWIEGTSLYTWAQQHSPSYRQVCQLLAHLARALATLHAIGAVHRDVKGDNVLVRDSDGRAVLIDFGSCHLRGTARLTWQSLPPHTPAYLSPQAALFELRLVRQRDAYYSPSPADDLYALGVTAYRLVTGHYPPELQPHQDGAGNWRVVSPDPKPLLDNKPGVHPLLREWILRLLSDSPEQRGSAEQLAQALEAEVVRHTEAPTPAQAPASEVVPTPAASVGKGPPRTRARRRRRQSFGPWLALAASAAMAVVLWRLPRPGAISPELPDAGTAVGNSAPSTPPASSTPPPKQSVSQDPPFVPGPEQARRAKPDAKGRCPRPKQMALNGFCWVELAPMTTEECTTGGYLFLKGKCYGPALEPQKTVPTSSPSKPH